MSQNPQPQGNQQAQPQKKMLKIRMKPGKGRMLIGRQWVKQDGSTVDKRPKDVDDRENVIENFLEARTYDGEQWSEGPFATVSEEVIAAFLKDSKDGQPHRILDGYKMIEQQGGLATDKAGYSREVVANWYPSKDRGALDDCPFEIVKVVN